jgi:general secretion pathway protein D
LLPFGVEIYAQKTFDVIRVRPTVSNSSEKEIVKLWSVFVYRPKYRPIQHFVDLLSSVFQGRFTSGGTQGFPSKFSTDTKGQSEPVSSPTSLGRDSDFLIFHGPSDEIEKLKNLLSQVDVPLPELVFNFYL